MHLPISGERDTRAGANAAVTSILRTAETGCHRAVRRITRAVGRAVGARVVAAATVLALLAAACAGPPTPPQDAPPPSPDAQVATPGLAPVGEARADQVPSEVDLAALDGLPVLSGLVWAIAAIGPEGPPTVAEVEAAVTEQFLALVSAENFIEQTSPLVADWRVTALVDVEALSVVVEITADADPLLLVVEVTDENPPRIEMMGLQLPMDDPAVFDGWEQATTALAEFGEQVVFLAAEVADGRCVPIAAHDPDVRGPLGSTFKLYVLAALVDAVERGALAWNDELEITDDLKSLPSGRLQIEPPGTTVTVAEAAELMIGISDNTATDMLIDVLGRETVEAAMADYGHGDPSVNQPLITTRELFQLAADEDATARFVAADETGRRAVLAELAGLGLPDSADLHLQAQYPQPVEWFASPAELCALLVQLGEATAGPGMEPARAAFAAEPRPRIDPDWELVGAKAGGQPGVQTRTWLLERDGTRYVFVISVDHGPDYEVAVQQLHPALEGAIELMARGGP